MAMSRILSQSLHGPSLRPPAALISHHRHRSTKTNAAHLIEVEIDQASSSPSDSSEAAADVITFGIKRLEDAIHRIIVRRAAPDWLPFRPGYSYWVPPRASAVRDHSAGSMIEVLGNLSSAGMAMNGGSENDLLSEDEDMAFTSTKGWPSSAFFIEAIMRIQSDAGKDISGTSPAHPIPMVEVEVKIEDNELHAHDDTSNTEDAEG
ncbi:hypothetical protein BUALT_Bualt11G0080800 [Buddleja alternifolia]|uniref:Chlororespiratory reduction 7 n=1 Tax=Buddleja alternifolia TaxID=168488 RepID=A0AAV6WTF3_9LAMI|nr:hypothetical protein BUALT_Bualt11G0080800 [Buddleja alternifolia]